MQLEDTLAYFYILRRSSTFGRDIFALRAKEDLIMLFWSIFSFFWFPLVNLLTFSSNLSNFVRNPLKPEKNPNKKFKKNS